MGKVVAVLRFFFLVLKSLCVMAFIACLGGLVLSFSLGFAGAWVAKFEKQIDVLVFVSLVGAAVFGVLSVLFWGRQVVGYIDKSI